MNLPWELHHHERGDQLGSVPYLMLVLTTDEVDLTSYIYYERNHYVVYYDLKFRGYRQEGRDSASLWYRVEAQTEYLAKLFVARELYRVTGGR